MLTKKQQAAEGSKLKRPVLILVTVTLLGVATAEIVSYFRGNLPSDTNSPMFVCSETGKPFRHTLKDRESIPVYSPYSGSNTGYPAEACFWTADGQIKKDPTWVLLNEAVGKPGPTFCPDCGRLVVGHNPFPHPGSIPPPTEAEYRARHPKAAAGIVREGPE